MWAVIRVPALGLIFIRISFSLQIPFVLCCCFFFSRAVSMSGVTYLVTMAYVCLVGCTYICISRRDPPPRNHQILKIPKPKFVSAYSELLFWETPPPPEGKIFDTRFGLIHVQTGKRNFSKKFFVLQNFLAKFFYAHFKELADLSVSQFSS